MSSDSDFQIADYFVVCGLNESSQPLKEDGASSWMNVDKKDPITEICIINKTLEEQCPLEFTCVETTPNGFESNLNHGSLTSHNLMLCYKRGRDQPPIVDIGVYDEGLDTLKNDIKLIETTPAGRSANVNNASGMGSHPIYLTYRRAKQSAPQNTLVVTDICIILPNKGEKAPYAYLEINKNLNKGLLGSNVHLCYKKSVRQVDSIAFRADVLSRYPEKDTTSFPLPDSVSLFCLPMGATIECWSDKTNHPLPCFSSFVLTTETSDKIFGTTVTFYESYPESKLTEQQRHHLRLLRGDGEKSSRVTSIHTNKAICILSHWPMFTAFKDFLMYLYRMTVSPHPHKIPIERYISHFIHKLPFPSIQRPRLEYQISSMIKVSITRPQTTPIPLSGASFVTLLENLGPENTLNTVLLALTEHKIVIHSLRVSEITCVAEALITLLFPFKWTCTYIPLCPLEMCHVLEAPCPFIAGVDSRYFDLFVPPLDIVCVNLDTNNVTLMDEKRSINWKMLPKKAAKFVRAKLQQCYKELKEQSRSEDISFNSSFKDPDLARVERFRRIDRDIQESFLKLMASMMRGYRKYLLPITNRPKAGTTDPGSLFNIQEFVKSRERASQRVFNVLVGCQLFSSFVEVRSLASFTSEGDTGSGQGGRTSSLVFFDQCIDRLSSDHALESTRLMEADSTLKSEHTVIILPPEEDPNYTGYVYTTFPRLDPHLLALVDETDGQEVFDSDQPRQARRTSEASIYSRRTAQEVRSLQKLFRMNRQPAVWAKLLLSNVYGCWFACLPSFVHVSVNKEAGLRYAFHLLQKMWSAGCLLQADETFYRILLHLCSIYDKAALAKKLFVFAQKHFEGNQVSAVTYGLYNKAVLDGTWQDNTRTGYTLWVKLRNVWSATVRLRILYGRAQTNNVPETSSDLDTSSRGSQDSVTKPQDETDPPKSDKLTSDNVTKVDQGHQSSGQSGQLNEDSESMQSDHGYNSMPKQLVRRSPDVTSSIAVPEVTKNDAANESVTIKQAEPRDVMTSSVKDEKTNEKFGGDSKMTSNCSDPLLSQQIKPQKLSLSSQDESRSNALSETNLLVDCRATNDPITSNDKKSPSIFAAPRSPIRRSEASLGHSGSKLQTPTLVHSTPVRSTSFHKSKSDINRKDISNLRSDPLSPLGFEQDQHVTKVMKKGTSNSLKRNLVDEIEDYMRRGDPLVRCSSDATISHQEIKSSSSIQFDDRKSTSSTFKQPTTSNHPFLSRSMTFGGRDSTGWLTSNSAKLFNGFLKTTTLSMANRAKLAATNIAKDLNESMKDSLAYYTNEVRGSFGELNFRGVLDKDTYSSQTSLKSSDSGTSNLDAKTTADKVRRRGHDNKTRTSRPCSMPISDQEQLPASFEPNKENKKNNHQTNFALPSSSTCFTQMYSEVEVKMISCSKCSSCKCLIYDEEIMSGWTDDDSDLKTHCFACNAVFVPFLDIEIKDCRETMTSSTSKQESNKIIELTFPYLSPFVLRKGIEDLLDNEGNSVLRSPSFVDLHPIIYWNLVWYFRRLKLFSNLFNLLLRSELLINKSKSSSLNVSSGSGPHITFNLLWDNLKLQQDRDRPPIYTIWPISKYLWWFQ